ncbi:TraB/GumN family protein [Pseudoalteromonas sp. NBT06-2]|uniref:TraB/GumN family protein n=1 Tax=Pseudoalteromonas sp. NBT06-2 TaxID=2025950 RepID=UPI000BA552D3|nr:TraB/GumN family protein [Pseudoalteromonas sp. NBT06-2]PAJ74824.1 TraB/GumN family protein [Pseudoalteromonas sp. NBT06-2]
MKSILKLTQLSTLFILICFSVSTFASPSLWLVEKQDSPLTKSYIFGTVHVGDSSMAKLPNKVITAIKETDEVIVEVDISKFTPFEIKSKTMPFMMLPTGKTLKTELKTKNYKTIDNYFKKKSIDINLFSTMQPWAVMLIITQMEYQNAGYNENNGIDKQVIAFANKNKIKVGQLETLEQQLSIFSQLSPYNDVMVSDTFSQLKDMGAHFDRLMNSWKNGSLKDLNTYYKEIFTKDEFGKLGEKVMLIDRNQNWLTQLTPRFKNESLFIAVGALHLASEQGLIQQLRNQGYKITKK